MQTYVLADIRFDNAPVDLDSVPLELEIIPLKYSEKYSTFNYRPPGHADPTSHFPLFDLILLKR